MPEENPYEPWEEVDTEDVLAQMGEPYDVREKLTGGWTLEDLRKLNIPAGSEIIFDAGQAERMLKLTAEETFVPTEEVPIPPPEEEA